MIFAQLERRPPAYRRASNVSWASREFTTGSGRVTSRTAFEVDGYGVRLEGEPPIAASRGWGSIGWMHEPVLGGD